MSVGVTSGGWYVLQNPTLRYKLDLGEPGLATPARASESILRVTAHELQNIARFKAKAAREGGIVIYHGITLKLGYRGSFLAASGGLSTAEVFYPEGKPGTEMGAYGSSVPLNTSPPDKAAAAANPAAGESAPQSASNTGSSASDTDLQSLKNLAKSKLQRIDAFINGNEPTNREGTSRAGSRESRNQEIQHKKQRAYFIRTQLENAIRKLEQMKNSKQAETNLEIQKDLYESFEKMFDLAFGISNAAHGGGQPADEAAGTGNKDNGDAAERASAPEATGRGPEQKNTSTIKNKLNYLISSANQIISGAHVNRLA